MIVFRMVVLLSILLTSVVPTNAFFIQPDQLHPLEPGVGTNRYAYSGGDPINRIDPSGKAAVPLPLVGGAIGGPIGFGIGVGAVAIIALGGAILHSDESWRNDGILPSEINPEINKGHQGKHTPGAHNNDPGRSQIDPGVEPRDLVAGARAGEYPQVGTSSRGDPVFDFGRNIGIARSNNKNDRPTRYGTIHSSKRGSHVVPADPDIYGKLADEEQSSKIDQDDTDQEDPDGNPNDPN